MNREQFDALDRWLLAQVVTQTTFGWCGGGRDGKTWEKASWLDSDPESGCFIVRLGKQDRALTQVVAQTTDLVFDLVRENNATEGDPAAIRAVLHRAYPQFVSPVSPSVESVPEEVQA